MLRIFSLLTAGFLISCSRNPAPTPDHRALETPAGEAVLRHVLSLCPHRSEAKLLTIVIGPRLDSATSAFEKKFTDTGLTVTPSAKLVAGAVNGEVRIFEGNTNQTPVILQISTLTPEPANPANYEATAAWSYKDKIQRWKLRVVSKPDQTFDITPIEEIPIAPRNQDGMPAPAAKP